MTSFWCGKALKQKKNKKIGLEALSRVSEGEGEGG